MITMTSVHFPCGFHDIVLAQHHEASLVLTVLARELFCHHIWFGHGLVVWVPVFEKFVVGGWYCFYIVYVEFSTYVYHSS
jgi:hypothetical protein